MTKAEWEKVYNELSNARSELAMHEHEYKHGSNKKKRSNAERQMGYKIHTIKHIIGKYPEVYTLASGGEGATDYDRIIKMDEFFQYHYVVSDLGKLLFEIQEVIKSFDKENTTPSDS